MNHEFVLVFELLARDDSNAQDFVARLTSAGCTGALVGSGSPGQLTLAFVREADSAEQAIAGALGDVRTAIPSARLLAVDPDSVLLPGLRAQRWLDENKGALNSSNAFVEAKGRLPLADFGTKRHL